MYADEDEWLRSQHRVRVFKKRRGPYFNQHRPRLVRGYMRWSPARVEWKSRRTAPARHIPDHMLKFLLNGEGLSALEHAAISHAEVQRHPRFNEAHTRCLRCNGKANFRGVVRCACRNKPPVIRVRFYNAIGFYKPQLEEFVAEFMREFPEGEIRDAAIKSWRAYP